MKKVIIISLLTCLIASACTQNSEAVIFGFETKQGKKLEILFDSLQNTIIYRYGSPDSIELEIADDLSDTTSIFKYSFWLRGGGKENEGLDINYFYFNNASYEYRVYSEYFAHDDSYTIGIRVKNLNSGQTFNIPGKTKSQVGSLTDFRYNELIPTEDGE